MNGMQFILYVRPELAPDKKAIDMLPANSKVVIQDIRKIPKPYPAFLTGTPILAEPRRQRIWKGKEVFDEIENYLSFLHHHPLALMVLAKVTPPNPPTAPKIDFPLEEAPSSFPPALAAPSAPPHVPLVPSPAAPAADEKKLLPVADFGYKPKPQPFLVTTTTAAAAPPSSTLSAQQPRDEDDDIAPLSPITRIADVQPASAAPAQALAPRKATQYPIRRRPKNTGNST